MYGIHDLKTFFSTKYYLKKTGIIKEDKTENGVVHLTISAL